MFVFRRNPLFLHARYWCCARRSTAKKEEGPREIDETTLSFLEATPMAVESYGWR